MGDADYLAVFHHILLPIAYEVTHWSGDVFFLEIFYIVHYFHHMYAIRQWSWKVLLNYYSNWRLKFFWRWQYCWWFLLFLFQTKMLANQSQNK